MALKSVLIANRGEIAIRIMRAASELGLRTTAICPEDDALSLHTRRSDQCLTLEGKGVRAYLDAEQVVAVAVSAGCDAIHPGYGFLSESADFARRCEQAGLVFVGPRPETLELFGDKSRARDLAASCDVDVLRGTSGDTTLEQAREFFLALSSAEGSLSRAEGSPPGAEGSSSSAEGSSSSAEGSPSSAEGSPSSAEGSSSANGGGGVMVKALAGGGGRGMRRVRSLDELEDAYPRCRSEAEMAFGRGEVYVEELFSNARHIEVQILGDDSGAIGHLWERECSIQRRHQKLIELAPCAGLDEALRDRLIAAAMRMAEQVGYRSLGTFEFLVGAGPVAPPYRFAFIEANPRLQVEHTVTEEVTGVDLVKTQLELASGRTLSELGLAGDDPPRPRGIALQVRINMETMRKDGTIRPAGGTLTTYEPPSGPGVRVDGYGYAGYTTSPRFDSLLAKVIVHSTTDHFADVVEKAYRALCEMKVEGVGTNLAFLQALLRHPSVVQNHLHTELVAEQVEQLVASAGEDHRRLYFDAGASEDEPPSATRLAGAQIDAADPLAILEHGKRDDAAVADSDPALLQPDSTVAGEAEGAMAVVAPLQGTVVSIDVAEGATVHAGEPVLVLEAMKMEHVIAASASGAVRRVAVSAGDTVFEGHVLLYIEPADLETPAQEASAEIDLDHIRPDLAEVHQRHAIGLDAARPEAVARRRKTGQRTSRENVDDLCDAGSFVEYGSLVVAAQRRRRSIEDLIANTPADGMLAGIGRINGDRFDESVTQCIVMSYDYTVLAGTQGAQNHRKKDRMFELAEKWRLPLVFFTEGGGGRPGDTDGLGVAGLDCFAFNYFGKLSGLVPLVGINSGRCFAGNAALLGCCDVVIATKGSNIGMGGPAMIEGGGLGNFRPEEVGPLDVQIANGVVDVAVEDEAEAVDVAKRYLSYFQGALEDWTCADQRLLRAIIPENRLRIYDVRAVIDTLADTGSVLELRRGFAFGMVTALARIEGRPIGIVANNPVHLAGAIDSDGADKAARFMQLCDAFDIPLLFLCDTPGIMVGPEVEKTALVRHAARMFVTSASLSVPFFTIVLRKGYGLGAQAMAGGSFKAPIFTVSWPTGEFGGMGLEGAVKLGFRKELAAIEDAEERRALFDEMVDRMYAHGKALNTATHFEIDDVIDPLSSREWIMGALRAAPPPAPERRPKRPCIDTW